MILGVDSTSGFCFCNRDRVDGQWRVVSAQTPDEGGVSFDGGGQEVLQSIFVPYMADAPFSLTLAAEWVAAYE